MKLGGLSADGVRNGLLASIQENGKMIGKEALDLASTATGRYSYLFSWSMIRHGGALPGENDHSG